MTVSITTQHNEDRLAGTVAHLTRGAGVPRLRLYAWPRPASANEAATGALLADIELLDPPGTVAGGVLTFATPPDGLVLVTGTAAWARFLNGEENASIDVDVSDLLGTGEVKLESVALIAGASVRVASAVLG